MPALNMPAGHSSTLNAASAAALRLVVSGLKASVQLVLLLLSLPTMPKPGSTRQSATERWAAALSSVVRPAGHCMRDTQQTSGSNT
jgi:hypothetical protein